MSIIEGISDETLAAMAESGHPMDGDEASQAINQILFDSQEHSIEAELPVEVSP